MRSKLKRDYFPKFLGIALIASLCFSCEDTSIEKDDNQNSKAETSVKSVDPALASKLASCPNGFWYDWDCHSSNMLYYWGLGYTQNFYVTNDKNYNWYIDQANTGSAANSNCGPSSVTMACQWYNQSFPYSAEDARNVYPNNNDWWYTNDIINYLSLRSVPLTVYRYQNPQQIINLLNNGNIMIACLNMGKIRYNGNPSNRVDRFYDYSSGHFLVIKGARVVDAQIFVEVYDPNNWYEQYSDGSQKGKNRHYRGADISNAISQWWNYLIVIPPSSQRFKSTESEYEAVDPSTIEVAYGK